MIKRPFFLIFFVFLVKFSFGQKATEKELYSFLQAQIKEILVNNDSIAIVEHSKSCFGSTCKAVLKAEGGVITVVYYVDRLAEAATDTSKYPFETIVDTSFAIPARNFLNHLESAKKYSQNSLVVAHTTTVYVIQHGDTKRNFTVENGLCLSYWLRYEKW